MLDKVAKRCKMVTKQHGNTDTLKPRYSVAHKATTGQSFYGRKGEHVRPSGVALPAYETPETNA